MLESKGKGVSRFPRSDMPAVRITLWALGLSCLSAGILPREAPEAKNRYDYWVRFQPGTFVTFQIRTWGAATSQTILKTFAVKQVTSQSVFAEYREALPAGAIPSAGNPPVLLGGAMEFPAHEDPAENADLLGSLFCFNPFRSWETEEGAEVDKGSEELIIHGTKIRASRTRIRWESRPVATTVTVWRSDNIPGTVVKGRRELRITGELYSTEEFTAVEYRNIPADPSELAKLRADRKPVAVEEPGSSFVVSKFRFFNDAEQAAKILKALAETFQKIGPDSPEADWNAGAKEWARYQAAAQAMKDNLSEDRFKIEESLEAAESRKLDAFLAAAGELAEYYLKNAALLQDLSVLVANLPVRRPSAHEMESLIENLTAFGAGFYAASKRAREEFLKLGSVKIRSLRLPD
jgi:hypothetical protein